MPEQVGQDLLRYAQTIQDFLQDHQQGGQLALGALADSQESQLLLWQAIIALESRLSTVEAELDRTKKLCNSSQQELAVRQIYHALNDKILLRVAQMVNQNVRQLFNNRVTSVGGLSKPEYRKAWRDLQKEVGIIEDATGFWDLLKDNKDPFDKFVHKDSYDAVKVLSYDELKTNVAAEVFIGDREKYEPTFQYLLEINKKLSDKMGQSLYEYPVSKKPAKPRKYAAFLISTVRHSHIEQQFSCLCSGVLDASSTLYSYLGCCCSGVSLFLAVELKDMHLLLPAM